MTQGQWIGEWDGQWLGQGATGETVTASASLTGSGGLTGTLEAEARTGSHGRRVKKYAKAYLRRDQEVLVFDSEEEKQEFIDAQKQAQRVIGKAKSSTAIVLPPVKPEIKTNDAEREQLIAAELRRMYDQLQDELEEEDIEMLLLA